MTISEELIEAMPSKKLTISQSYQSKPIVLNMQFKLARKNRSEHLGRSDDSLASMTLYLII